MEGRRRVTLYEQMSATHGVGRGLAGLTLDDVLANHKISESPPSQNRTLLQHIQDEDRDKPGKKSWKAFREKLRLKRAGGNWTSSIQIPASDIPVPVRSNRPDHPRRYLYRLNLTNRSASSHAMNEPDPVPISDPPMSSLRSQFSQRSMNRHGSLAVQSDPSTPGESPESASLRPQMSRRNSTRIPGRSESNIRERRVVFRDEEDGNSSDEDELIYSERTLSAREAVAAQEAAEAAANAAAAAAGEEEEEGEPVKTSLMDLLDGYDDEEYEEEEEEEVEEAVEEGTVEYDCCVCMVRHKGAAFIPCGHTFCRLCSRELYVSRKYCPLCNGFICEILDIF